MESSAWLPLCALCPLIAMVDAKAVWRIPALLAATVVCAIAAMLPPPTGLTPAAIRALSLLAWAVICWAGNLMDDYIVAMSMGIGWILFRVVPFDVAFACFSTSSWWMMVGALGLGVAVSESGLLRRAALLTLRALPPSFAGQTVGLICAGIPLGPALPTVTGKTTMAAPFVLGIAEAMGLEDRSDHSTGLFMSMFAGFGLMGPLFMTGTVTNFVLLALLPESIRAHITWGSWFITYLPTMAILLTTFWLGVMVICRPKRVTTLSREYLNSEIAALGRLGRKEKTTIGTLAATLILWMTGPLHGIDGATVALAAVVFLSVAGILDRAAFQGKISWTGLLYVGFTLNLAEVLPYLGIDAWLGTKIQPIFAPLTGHPALFFAVLMLTVFVMRQFLISDFAVVTIMVLMLTPVATAAGISPWTIGIATHLMVQSVWILPFQSDTYLVSHQAAQGRLADQRKATLLSLVASACTVLAVLASMPYWRYLGLLPR
ncbi:MAG: SLC13 family permease [Bacillota bacterium]